MGGRVQHSVRAARRATGEGLRAAVHRSRPLSRAGVLERLFTAAFRRLVYPQIWEDPVVDLEALRLGPSDRVATIASGGCNALSYLTADPAEIVAVDLNGAHVALGRLKLCALKHLPDYESFRRFFADANSRANVAAYDLRLRGRLDAATRAYWDGRPFPHRRRIELFARNIYRFGLLGHCIAAGHTLARLHGCDPRVMLNARSRDEQRALFERHLAPIFDKPLVRWLTRQPASLYGLGIPPAQYQALAGDSEGGIAAVLRQRLERLACDFDISDNYFAAQAFGGRYAEGETASLPPYLQRRHFAVLRERADRLSFVQGSLTQMLDDAPAASFDAYVLLDAQDWMNDQELTALWTQISRTARPGARVVFRTAADERLLPGRVAADALDGWVYHEALSRDLGRRDRSSIYGGFHLYERAA
jgi:S-adenosylmethionine-diacylglycerol 3-amino-3-carboxypropyl transferase